MTPRPQPRFRRLSRAIAVVGAIALALILAYTAFWFYSAYRLRGNIEAWVAARRADGYQIAWEGQALSGFPGAMRISLTNVRLARGAPATYEAVIPEISAASPPWDLRHWHAAAPQGGQVTLPDLPTPIAAASLEGDVAVTPEDYALDVAAYRISAGAASAGEIDAHFILPQHPPADHRERSLAATIEMWNLVLPGGIKPLGDRIESLGVAVDFMGALPQGDLREALARWRDDGGTVEIQRAELHWGALSLQTEGTVALDKEMQPLAALTASITDQDALIDASVAAGMLPAKNGGLIKLVLGLLAKNGPDGVPRLTAPITVQDQKIYIGKAEVGRVPRIDIE